MGLGYVVRTMLNEINHDPKKELHVKLEIQ